MEDREYSGKHVVVTGGGSGIGRALVPGPGMASYHASKAAACSLGESLSIELAPAWFNKKIVLPKWRAGELINGIKTG